jgi:hypothetical protein
MSAPMTEGKPDEKRHEFAEAEATEHLEVDERGVRPVSISPSRPSTIGLTELAVCTPSFSKSRKTTPTMSTLGSKTHFTASRARVSRRRSLSSPRRAGSRTSASSLRRRPSSPSTPSSSRSRSASTRTTSTTSGARRRISGSSRLLCVSDFCWPANPFQYQSAERHETHASAATTAQTSPSPSARSRRASRDGTKPARTAPTSASRRRSGSTTALAT